MVGGSNHTYSEVPEAGYLIQRFELGSSSFVGHQKVQNHRTVLKWGVDSRLRAYKRGGGFVHCGFLRRGGSGSKFEFMTTGSRVLDAFEFADVCNGIAQLCLVFPRDDYRALKASCTLVSIFDPEFMKCKACTVYR